ncbi:uncharacterized protein [Diadema antillarum]|uniref:uncharacterized protein n=1 Tax=Diadema antillarum TaxID=105358 RepID=UPI003A88C0F9
MSWVLMAINYMQVAGELPFIFEPQNGWQNLSTQDIDIAKVEECLLSTKGMPHQLGMDIFRKRVVGQSPVVKKNLDELLQGFFEYYADFAFTSRKIAVRTGGAPPRRTKGMGRIFIEAPEMGTNTASAITGAGFDKIKDKLRRARNILRSNENWMDINIMAP